MGDESLKFIGNAHPGAVVIGTDQWPDQDQGI